MRYLLNEISLRVRLDEIYMYTCLSSVYQFFSRIRGLYLNKKLNMVIVLNIGQMSKNGGSKMAIIQELSTITSSILKTGTLASLKHFSSAKLQQH